MTDKAPERIWAQDADPDECDFIGGGWWDDSVGSVQHPHTVEYVRADLAPAVKQLCCDDEPDGAWSQSRTGAGWEYLIRDMGDYFLMPFPWKPPERFSTMRDAKAAAQADFERRVRECLV